MTRLNLPLIAAFLLPLLLPPLPVAAQAVPAVAAVPAGAVDQEILGALAPAHDVPVVFELFSSQACIFCPAADRLLADLAGQENVIALACHVDYFDVRRGAFSKPFCTTRQAWYMKALNAGPNYTPQLVINGRQDVIGYKYQLVADALKEVVRQTPLRPLTITPRSEGGTFSVNWEPSTLPGVHAPYRLWIAAFDKPHEVTIAQGHNKGQKMTYVNIVSDLRDTGIWDERQNHQVVNSPLTETQTGFALLAADPETGHIVAAGKYLKP